MSSKVDVIIIGGGINGMIAAAYLAKAGRRVLVLEKKKHPGGRFVSEEILPGFSASFIADESDTLSPKIIADLKLKQFGLQVLPTDPLIFSPQQEGQHLTIWHDVHRTRREIARFSRADAKIYPEFIAKTSKIARIVSALNHMILPDMPDAGVKDALEALKLVKPMRSLGWKQITQVMRILTLPLADYLNEWFESDIVKAALAVSALNHISLGPQETGTGYAFLQNFAHSKNALFRAGGQILGGAGGLTKALVMAIESLGVKIRTEAEVSQIYIENKRAAGVALVDGKTISAGGVVSAVDMRTTFSKLVDSSILSKTVLKHVQNISYGGTMARVHYALDTLPVFRNMAGLSPNNLNGHIQVAPTMTYLQKAFDPVKYGQYSERPYLDIRIPTLNDSSLAPKGKHVMSVTVKYIPYHLRGRSWDTQRDDLGQLVTKIISNWAPDFDQYIKHCHVITPLDMETDYNLPEGSFTHGDTTLDQSFWMRPIPGFGKYRSPIKRLYLCSAATHPGGGYTGINGLNAARMILKS